MSDSRRDTDAHLQREIDQNRRAERWLVLKAVVALAVVALPVVIRQVFFV